MDITGILSTILNYIHPVPYNGSPVKGAGTIVAIRDGYKLQEVPAVAFVAPGRRHSIDTVEDFAAYLKRHFEPGNTEILAGLSKIVAISEISWDRDEVTCSLAIDPTWKDWMGIFGHDMSQKDLFRFLLQHREDGALDSALTGLRLLEVSSTGKVSGSLDERGFYRAVKSDKGTDVNVTIPPSIKVSLPVYLGTKERYDLVIDLEIDVVDGRLPTFTLRPQDLERVKQAALDTEVERLRKALGDVWLVTRGTMGLTEK